MDFIGFIPAPVYDEDATGSTDGDPDGGSTAISIKWKKNPPVANGDTVRNRELR